MASPFGGKGSDPACSAQAALLSVAAAPSFAAALAGNWTRLPLTYGPAGTPRGQPFPPLCVNWEDQNIWVDSAGHFHALMHAFRGQNTSYPLPGCASGAGGAWAPAGCTALGGHLFSEDGARWYVSPEPAYRPAVDYSGGASVLFRARERPHVLMGARGEPAVFLSAVGDPGCGGNTGCAGQDHSFTLFQALG